MAGRGRAALTSRKGGRAVAENVARRPPSAAPKPLLYTGQDLARFCEVDLKTIHHWADAGKIPHHRTEGRHLRFRRNHVLAFLRRHGYPLHAELATVRPTVFLAMPSPEKDGAADETPIDEIAKKLSGRFFVRRFENALTAIAHLVAGEPDALVVSLDDPTWTGARATKALKARADTSWTTLVVIGETVDDAGAREVQEAGANLVVAIADVGRLNGMLARALGVA
jgi:excisionase family DNA binding protein